MTASNIWHNEQTDADEGPIIRKSPHLSPYPLLENSKINIVKKGEPAKKLADSNVLLSVKRLMVIIPNEDVDEAQLSRKIWTLASNYRLDVLLISMAGNSEESMAAVRRLTTIAAMTRDSHFKLEKKVVFAHSWDKALRQYWQQTDMILCPQEKNVNGIFGKTYPLSQFLCDRLKMPVYTFSDLYQPDSKKTNNWLHTISFWAGFLVIMLLCFYFELDVDQSIRGWIGQVLLIMVVSFEIGLLYLWTLIAG